MPLSLRALSITPMLPSPPSAMGRRRICGMQALSAVSPLFFRTPHRIPSRTASDAWTAVIEPLNLSVAITILLKAAIIFLYLCPNLKIFRKNEKNKID